MIADARRWPRVVFARSRPVAACRALEKRGFADLAERPKGG